MTASDKEKLKAELNMIEAEASLQQLWNPSADAGTVAIRLIERLAHLLQEALS